MEQRALNDMVSRHDQDLYRGDPPGTGLTTRVALLEQEIEKMARNLNKLTFCCVTLLLGILGQLIKAALFH